MQWLQKYKLISLQSSTEDCCSLTILTGHFLFQTYDDLESCSHGLRNKTKYVPFFWVSAYGFRQDRIVLQGVTEAVSEVAYMQFT